MREYPVDLVFEAVDRITATMRRINGRIERMAGPFRRVNNQLRALDQATGFDRLRASIGGVGMAAGRVVGQVMRIGSAFALITAGAVAGLYAMANAASTSGDQLAKLADRVGMNINAVAEYQFVAGRAGIEQSAFNTALDQFSKRLGEARAGTGSLKTLLDKASPAFLRQLQAARSNEEALDLMFEAMAKIEDPARRAALASAAFGRSGLAMANMVTNGTGEIRELRGEFQRLAGDQTKFARESEVYNDTLGDLQLSMVGIRNAVLGELFPALTALADALKNLVADRRAEIAAWARDFAAALPARLAALRNGVERFLERLRPLVDIGLRLLHVLGMGTAEALAVALAGVVVAPLLGPVAALAAALLSPAGLLLLGFAAAVVAWRQASAAVDRLTAAWRAAWATVGEAAGTAATAVRALPSLLAAGVRAVSAWLRRLAAAVGRLVPDWMRGAAAGAPALDVRGDRPAGGDLTAAASLGGAQAVVAEHGAALRHRRQLVADRRVEVVLDGVPRGADVDASSPGQGFDFIAHRALLPA